jgi:riboflavin kinase/FMN adenylyltransferase
VLFTGMAFAGRRLVRRGDGRAHRVELAGVVERGDGRGRSLGFPTANLAACADAPADGVYAGWAFVDDAAQRRAALVVVGDRPTFAGVERRVETHLLDFAGDLYGRRLRIALEVRVGDVRAYPSPAALAAAIRGHATAARRALARAKGGRSWS